MCLGLFLFLMLSNNNNWCSRDNNYSMIRILSKLKQGLNIIHINAQSLLKKIDEFRFLFNDSHIDVICVTETWFRKDMPDSFVKLDEYNLYRADRLGHAGGAAMYVKNTISSRVVCSSSPNDAIEYIFLSVGSGNQRILLGSVYRPNRRVDIGPLLDMVREIALPFQNILIAGDFNSNLLVESGMVDEFRALGLYSVNTTVPTHYTNTTDSLLDLFLVNSLEDCLHYDQLSSPIFSRHDIIFLTYKFSVRYDDRTIRYRDFRNIDYDQLSADMRSVPWDNIYFLTGVDDKVKFFEDNVTYLYDKHVPLKSKVVKPRQQPWFNDTIRNMLIRRDRAYRRWKRFKTVSIHDEYRSIRREVTRKIMNAKTEFYANKFAFAVTSRQKWKEVRSIGIGRSNGTIQTTVDLEELNHAFANIDVPLARNNVYMDAVPTSVSQSGEDNFCFGFQCVSQCDVLQSILDVKSNATGLDGTDPMFLKPLLPLLLPHVTHIFNHVLTTSIFPNSWKRAKIVPIPKSNSEYRPIAILPFLSKALENIIYKQINAFVLEHHLLTDRQSGFRAGRSCTTALLDIAENIRSNIDSNGLTYLVLLDHSKAFDSVNHAILSTKLGRLFNFSSSAVALVRSYLVDRSQAVCMGGSSSGFVKLDRGVPQGSVLGPLLFSLYLNDLVTVPEGCDIQIYADDVQVCFSSDVNNIVACNDHINCNLRNIYNWATNNGLMLNPCKTKCLVISRNGFDATLLPSLMMGGSVIEYVSSARNLGVIFSNDLSWNRHIDSTMGQVYGMLRTLWSIQNFIPLHIRSMIAKSYLLSRLLYCCELYSNCDSVHRGKLTVLTNDIARFVYGIRRSNRASLYVRQLYGMEFHRLLQYRCLIALHKIIYTCEPKYLFDRLRFSRSSRSNCIIPIRYNYLVSDRQFFVYAVRLWNTLPLNLRNVSHFNQFKSKLLGHFTLLQH